MDADDVALAAVQGLNKLEEQLQAKKARIADLEQWHERLERIISNSAEKR